MGGFFMGATRMLAIDISADFNDLLSPERAALRLGLSAVTLARWRSQGTGPKWHRVGAKRVVYAPADLEAFAPTPKKQSQYALVCPDGELWLGTDGAVPFTTFRETPPGDDPRGQWLPIVNVDAAPFNPAKHYRTGPTFRVNGDHVQRVFGIIEQ